MADDELPGPAAKALGHSLKTVLRWAEKDSEFEEDFHAAREAGYYRLAESLMTIFETERDPAKAKILSDNLKWLLSKWNAKKYGDKIEITGDGTVSIALALEQARARTLPRYIDGEAVEVLPLPETASE